MVVIERTGRRRRLVGEPDLLQAGQELLEMLAAEMAEHVLARRLLAAPDKRVLVYCGGGIAATLDAFVLTALLGHNNVSVYDNSMQEWSNDSSLPMEVG